MKARGALIAICLAGCAQPQPALHPGTHPLEGRIWDVRAEKFVPADEALARAARATHVILGETHDNAEHHRLQRRVLESLSGPRALAMEQFDSEHQAAIDAAQAKHADAEAIADAGHFDRKGWNWPLYRPLVELAVERGWRIIAANLSRSEARRVVADPGLSPLPPAPSVTHQLERDIAESHCGERPQPKLLAGMVAAQRARDARMASVMKGRTVLITGNGHARRDVGVPLYLKDPGVVSVALLEAEPGKAAPREYLRDFYSEASFDFVWFTARHPRADPCAGR